MGSALLHLESTAQMQLTHPEFTKLQVFTLPHWIPFFFSFFFFSRQKKYNSMCDSKEVLSEQQPFVVNMVSINFPRRWNSSITKGCRRFQYWLGQRAMAALINPKNCFATLSVTTENYKRSELRRTPMSWPLCICVRNKKILSKEESSYEEYHSLPAELQLHYRNTSNCSIAETGLGFVLSHISFLTRKCNSSYSKLVLNVYFWGKQKQWPFSKMARIC